MIRHLRALADLRVRRVTWPFPALELVRPDGRGWLICPLPNHRTENDR
ncbi:hypothetical protein P3T27_006546 [Kitasatospora sp. MAA19]|nr:hypothetical protein [Kitasatospora sp. MAA19]MDH6709797.1 hypothetical protein [Kitasatospora sp. MAA19]